MNRSNPTKTPPLPEPAVLSGTETNMHSRLIRTEALNAIRAALKDVRSHYNISIESYKALKETLLQMRELRKLELSELELSAQLELLPVAWSARKSKAVTPLKISGNVVLALEFLEKKTLRDFYAQLAKNRSAIDSCGGMLAKSQDTTENWNVHFATLPKSDRDRVRKRAERASKHGFPLRRGRIFSLRAREIVVEITTIIANAIANNGQGKRPFPFSYNDNKGYSGPAWRLLIATLNYLLPINKIACGEQGLPYKSIAEIVRPQRNRAKRNSMG